jgi:hypothetical protein
VAKIVIMCQEGSIPANLHYKSPQYGMRAIRNGLVQVRLDKMSIMYFVKLLLILFLWSGWVQRAKTALLLTLTRPKMRILLLYFHGGISLCR